MAVERRELKNPPGRDLFLKPLCFHNTKHNSCIVILGVCANGNYYGARVGFYDTEILKDEFAEYDPDTFWRLVAFPEVREIDITQHAGFKITFARQILG